jgi:membrane-bound ClpP family serine protease
MPSWHELLTDIKVRGSTFDVVRRDALKKLHRVTGRNVILYYSGWLQKSGIPGMQVNDADKNGFMTVIHGLDRKKGLDLILHTPGGETAATESLVDYLHSMFGTDIRAIVPQLAMSAGTMIACACKKIIMGKQSSLGPIDPQFGNLPAHGIVEEFKRAVEEVTKDPRRIPIWQPIIARYHPTLIGECEKAIQWSNDMVKEWLVRGMLNAHPQRDNKSAEIVTDLSDHALTKSHARHLSAAKCKAIGLDVEMLEDDAKLQDAVLTVHHACVHTLAATPAFKMIENHKGVAFFQMAQQQVILQGPSQAEQLMPVIPVPLPSPAPEPQVTPELLPGPPAA